LRGIVAKLNADGTPTAQNGKWYKSTVRAVIVSVDLDELDPKAVA